ncbi:hypothetical protein [Halopelagius fulvigenes]|uniref:Uncharacterized protein n=1 Tax=Halopelagius fulvigenes TaxID=1198324 RepID=A0ABD5U0S2_9EURY
MRRRQFIVGSGLGALVALSGCLGSKSPPPRKSNVISNFEVSDTSLVIDSADNTWVMSRYEDTQQQSLGGLNPVGVASAKGKSGGGGGRGASGRGSGGYSSAPRTKHGYAWYHGGDYADDWYENHGDEVSRFPVGIAALGVAYLGSTSQFRDDAPGPGAVPWDKTFQNPDDTVKYDITNGRADEGWYRVGAKIVGTENDHSFRWESYDLEIDRSTDGGYSIQEEWKVSPRI